MNPCPVLIGRRQEMATLRSLLDAGGGFALISGEAGIGKSRLVREFALEAEKAGRVVVWGRPEQVEQPGPFALIVDLLEGLAERSPRDLARDARGLAAELLRPAEDGRRAAPTARQTAAELRGLLSQLDAPPMVVLEDLHAADEASHAVVLHIARSAADDRYLIASTMRPTNGGASASLSRFLDEITKERIGRAIQLSIFSHDETAWMLEAMWGRPPTPEELKAFESLGEGVPFFIEELAIASGEDGSVVVPKSLEQLILSRARGLGTEATRVLTAASLTIGAIDPAVIAHACDLSVNQVTKHLTEAAKAGLVADDEGKLIFRHGLIREAVAGSVVSIEAPLLHDRLARAIEAVYAKSIEQQAFTLALHYRNAEQPLTAANYYVIAGRRFLTVAATEDARAAFTEAHSLSRGALTEAIRGLAEVDLRDGREREAATLYRKAATTLLEQGDPVGAAQVLGRLAWAMVRVDDSEKVAQVLDESLALLSGLKESEEYARLLIQKGVMLTFLLGQHAQAEPILRSAADIARRLGNEALMAEVLDGLAQVADSQGRGAEALSLGTDAIERASDSGDAEVIGRTHNNHAIKLACMGNSHEALAVLAEGRASLQRAYGRAAVGALDVTHAWVARLMGLPKDVRMLTARGQVAWQRWRGYRTVLEIWAALEQDDVREAESHLASAWKAAGGVEVRAAWLAGEIPLTQDASQLLQGEVLLKMAAREWQAASDTARAMVALDRRISEKFDLGLALSLLARAELGLGSEAGASRTLAELRNLIATYGYPYLNGLLLEGEGLLAIANGDIDAAIKALDDAARELQLCSNSSDRARCKRISADLLVKSGADKRSNESERLLRDAHEMAVAAGATSEINRTEALLRSMGIRLRIGRPRRSSKSDDQALSPREAEVAILVAAGETNAMIAGRLFLSQRTVQDHISNALRKLRLSGRAALASWAVKNGMI